MPRKCRAAVTSDPVGGFKTFPGAILSIRRVEYDIARGIKALGQFGLSRAHEIAKPFSPAGPPVP